MNARSTLHCGFRRQEANTNGDRRKEQRPHLVMTEAQKTTVEMRALCSSVSGVLMWYVNTQRYKKKNLYISSLQNSILACRHLKDLLSKKWSGKSTSCCRVYTQKILHTC